MKGDGFERTMLMLVLFVLMTLVRTTPVPMPWAWSTWWVVRMGGMKEGRVLWVSSDELKK